MWIHSSQVELQHFQCSKDQTGRFCFHIHSIHPKLFFNCRKLDSVCGVAVLQVVRRRMHRTRLSQLISVGLRAKFTQFWPSEQVVTKFECGSKIYTILAFRASCDSLNRTAPTSSSTRSRWCGGTSLVGEFNSFSS